MSTSDAHPAMMISSLRSRARSASASTCNPAYRAGGRLRSSPVLNPPDTALRTTGTPAASAACRNLPRTLTAEKSKPENGGEVQHQAGGAGRPGQGLPEVIRQGADAAEKEVAAQPVGVHPLPLPQQDGAVGDGAGFAAPALARGEPLCYRIHAAEAHGEEHQGGEHADAHALDQSEGQDGNEDQQNDAVLRPGEPPAARRQALVEHAEAGKHQDSPHER